jgi:hypothetical protein
MMRFLFPALAIFCLAACGQKDTDPGPGGVSVGEARALDEAASMLDQQRLPPAALASGAPSARAQENPAPKPSASPPG